mgnify:CR=1 FL=1
MNTKNTQELLTVHLLVAAKAVSGSCELEIYLSDNASDTEDQQQLLAFMGEMDALHFHVNDENLGFSAGHNSNLF